METERTLSDECQRWDERYATEAWFFGTEPSPFLQSALAARPLMERQEQPPRALCLGEGEGRDAIFLARCGLSVTAVDGSAVGLSKLASRAQAEGLSVQTVHADLSSYQPALGSYQLITSFYCHLPPSVRARVHARAAAALAPEGQLVVEGFSTLQRDLGLNSGGPPNRKWLFSKSSLLNDFRQLRIVQLRELHTEINYGRHRGEAAIIRLCATATGGRATGARLWKNW